jgi:hypothetical protein
LVNLKIGNEIFAVYLVVHSVKRSFTVILFVHSAKLVVWTRAALFSATLIPKSQIDNISNPRAPPKLTPSERIAGRASTLLSPDPVCSLPLIGIASSVLLA